MLHQGAGGNYLGEIDPLPGFTVCAGYSWIHSCICFFKYTAVDLDLNLNFVLLHGLSMRQLYTAVH